ncbi:VOC family protein [Thermobifida halotolerans]|uniref:VOC family protein n=1 Tax=Thermobifida halotolerans TaxID=483545 RepID=A0A399G7Z9_9ACTN|nr:VOC family protein [Thermobifida halotolerans]UOE21015.1 VOC family protein [Thermobifida halotolerans]
MSRIGRLTVLVADLDAAIDFYTGALGFRVLFDARLPSGFRSVHVGPGAVDEPGLWLMPAEGDRVGSRTAGAPLLVLYSDDLDKDLDRLAEAGVMPHLGPEGEPGARYAHVRDPWGNEIVLAQTPRG